MFIQEFYAISEDKKELLFELVERLKQNNYITLTLGLGVEQKIIENYFSLPVYSNEQLQEIIKIERENYFNE